MSVLSFLLLSVKAIWTDEYCLKIQPKDLNISLCPLFSYITQGLYICKNPQDNFISINLSHLLRIDEARVHVSVKPMKESADKRGVYLKARVMRKENLFNTANLKWVLGVKSKGTLMGACTTTLLPKKKLNVPRIFLHTVIKMLWSN
ncbi:polysaccharide pyruvyl transferase family protein [Sesbania bispinosa]|nr:polysaccharide pyruvyl transferase family protein [Sesbania bispinosa]